MTFHSTDYTFKPYTDGAEVDQYGVKVGDDLYVGGGMYNGRAVVAMFQFTNQGCYSSDEATESTIILPISDCEYLVDEPGNFEWLPSSNGVVENGAVMYKGFNLIGRGFHLATYPRIGEVSRTRKCLVYGFNWEEYTVNTYDALIYIPHKV